MSAPTLPNSSRHLWPVEAPSNWQLGPLKHLIERMESGVSVNALDQPSDPGIPGVLKTSCVYTGEFDPRENKTVVESERHLVACPVEPGALIVSRMNTPDLVGSAGLVRAPAPDLYLPDRLWQIRFTGLNPRFAHYWTQSALYRLNVQVACAGTSASMQNLSQDDFRGFPIAVPPVDLQGRLADWLDRETARIDALIEKKTRFIELLREKRQALITCAVDGWQRRPLKYAIHFLTSGPRGWSDAIADDGAALFVQSGDLTDQMTLAYQHAARIDVAASAEAQRTRLRAGDVVVCITGANTGRVALADEPPCQAFVNQHLCLIRPNQAVLAPAFLALVLHSRIGRAYFEQRQYGLKEGLSLSDVGDVPIPLPSLGQQDRIVEDCRRRASVIDQLVVAVDRSVLVLKERRAALVTGAVTGQIDLREEAPYERLELA